MKILLVDDEFYILNGLKNLIRGAFPDLSVFTADCAQEARKILLSEKPDILIIDIRIAGENGLDVVRDIRKVLPDLHVYVISGYSEFEYAKRAIQLNVRYYFLKPISQEKITGLVAESIREIEETRAYREDRKKNLEMARKKAVFDMIREGGCPEELRRELERLKTVSLFERFHVVNISIKEYWMIATCSRSVQFSNLKMFLRRKIADLLEEVCGDNYLFVEDEAGNYTVILDLTDETLDALLCHIYEVIREDFRLYSEIRASREYCGEQMFYQAYCESRGITSASGSMSFHNDKERSIVRELREIYDKAAVCMKEENYLQLASMIELFIPHFFKENTQDGMAWKFADGFCRELSVYLKEKNPKTAELFSDFSEEEMSSDELKAAYEDLARAFRTCQREVNSGRNREIVKKVILYMDAHIENVTLENAANYVEITPIYLSIIFKEVEGINFKEYLIARRVETARRLLAETEDHIYEISAAVGYSDVKYFSRVFKRYVGMRPQEYRSEYHQKKEDV